MSDLSPFDELSRTGPSVPNQKFMEDEDAKNTADCVDSQSSDMQEKNEDSKPSWKRKQEPVYEEQCDSADENTVLSSCRKKKHKAKAIKLRDEQLDLRCEWRDCGYRTCNLDHFVSHVSLHIPHLEVRVNEDQGGTGSVVFPRILPTSSSTWQYGLPNHLLAHINFRLFF
jgi:hypothetical protein